jgi:hypothetical protein
MAIAGLKSEWIDGVLTFLKRGTNAKVVSINQLGFGRFVTREDQDAQNATLLAAQLAKGLLVHTSVTGGGTLTVDTASNLVAAFPEWQIGETRECYYQNDGDQTVTLTGDTGTTRVSAQTIATLQGRRIVFLKTAADAFAVWAD